MRRLISSFILGSESQYLGRKVKNTKKNCNFSLKFINKKINHFFEFFDEIFFKYIFLMVFINLTKKKFFLLAT